MSGSATWWTPAHQSENRHLRSFRQGAGLWAVVAMAALAVVASVALQPVQAEAIDQRGPQRIRADEGLAAQEHPNDDLDRKMAMGRFPRSKPGIGTVRTWPAFDWVDFFSYPKDFTLRAVGQHVEVWVASGSDRVSSGLRFPEGDCRNGSLTEVTEAQLSYLVQQFDTNIHPRQSEAFSVAPPRDGKHAELPARIPEVPSSAFKGEGDNLVVLVDNIRNPSFYRIGGPSSPSGFFDRRIVEDTDRNVLTLSGVAWAHRLGQNPVHSPAPGDPCSDRPANPHDIEGVLAHEHQHLLEYYEDEDETEWVDEGLAEWARTLSGYKNPALTIADRGFTSNIQAFLGFAQTLNPSNPLYRPGGPENSLTMWGDQGVSGELAADYGAVYTFMELLHGRYGTAFMSALHRDDRNSLEGLAAVLEQFGVDAGVVTLVRDWAATTALDAVLDDGAELYGADPARFSTPTLHSQVNWDVADAYSAPGAPANGADFVRLRDADGRYLNADEITSLSFEAPTGASFPVHWTVDPVAHGEGGSALRSGSADVVDRSIVRQITVPESNPVLTFDTRYDIEPGYDFGFVQVSTDGGATYRSLPGTTTTADASPSTVPAIRDNLPGYSGSSGGWITESVDLSAYAGQTLLLAFRYVTDEAVAHPGWWVDNMRIGGAVISDGSNLAGWQTMTQLQPLPVPGFGVRLVAYTTDHRAAWTGELSLDLPFRGTLEGAELESVIGAEAEVVGAIVTVDDPDESLPLIYPRYTLTVNGVVQPGG